MKFSTIFNSRFGRTKIVFATLICIFGISLGSYWYFFNTQGQISIENSNPDIQVTLENNLLADHLIRSFESVLQENSANSLHVSITTQKQQFTQLWDGEEYIGFSVKPENDILVLNIFINAHVLKKYHWNENDVATELEILLLRALIYEDERLTTNYLNYTSEMGSKTMQEQEKRAVGLYNSLKTEFPEPLFLVNYVP